MADYRSNKTCEEIDAILDNATPKGVAGDGPNVLSLQGARSYAEVLSKASLICAGRITALYTTGWATIGAEVEIYDAFKVKYGDNAPTITKVILVDKRVSEGIGVSTTRFLYSGDYEGCYFVMGDFEGNDSIFGLGATKGDWIIAQNLHWAKIVTKQREIAGIKGDVTANALARKLSTAAEDNTNPLATKTELSGFVKVVKVNDETKTPDENGIVDLGSVSGEVSEEQIAGLGFTKNKGTVTKVADVQPDEYGHISVEELSKKLNIGSNTATSVNFANDLTGRIEATPEMFTYRPSAGDKSVRDESAVIRRIKGNSVIFSQSAGYVKNRVFNGVTIVHNNDGVVELSGELTGGEGIQSGYLSNVYGHKYLIVMEVLSMGDATSFLGGNLNVGNTSFNEAGKKWLIRTSSRNGYNSYVGLYNLIGSYNGVKYRYQQFDLTEMFGAGNEPTTYEEFRQYYPDDYYPYCEPVLRSMRATGIETIGFNAYNGEYAEVIGGQTYYLGGTIDTAHFATEIGGEMTEITIPENRLYTPSENGYIYASGSDICINLSHSGVRNGEYEEYEKNTLLLPEIAKYFPNGMHGVGDVCDEIDEEMAIQRCAVRAYEEGDENNSEVKTDKITTVYKLAVPIYTPIDELVQLDYKVDDFGTERMLSNAPSAPFKADIVYQFNAEGRIRDNSRNIEKLEELVKQPSDWMEDNPNSPAYIKNKPTLPTQVTTATEVIVEYGIPAQMLPNVVYELAISIENFTFPELVSGEENVRNVWKLIAYMAPGTVISYPLTIKWRDGIPPTIDAAAFVELTFTSMTMQNAILGEWKLYK